MGLTDEEIIQFYFGAEGADKVAAEAEKIGSALEKVRAQYAAMGVDLGKVSDAQITAAAKHIVDLKEEQNQMNKVWQETRKLNLESNQMLIVGYSLSRVFGGFFKDLIDSYTKLTTTQNSVLTNSITPLNKSLIGLTASFEYLKFSLIEAASGPIQFVAEALTNLFEFLANTDPAVLESIAVGIGAIAAAGILLVGGGEVLKGIALWKEFLAGISNPDVVTGAGNLVTKLSALKGIIGAGLLVDVGLRLGEDFADGKKIGLTQAITNALEAGVGAGLLVEGTGGYAFSVVLGLELASSPDLVGQVGQVIGAIGRQLAALEITIAQKVWQMMTNPLSLYANDNTNFMTLYEENLKKANDIHTALVQKEEMQSVALTAAKIGTLDYTKQLELMNQKHFETYSSVLPNVTNATNVLITTNNNLTKSYNDLASAAARAQTALKGIGGKSIPDFGIGINPTSMSGGLNLAPLPSSFNPSSPMGSQSHG